VEEANSPQVLVQTTLEPNREWLQVIVRDNGPGIPEDKQEDIFKPFMSTKGAKGTGLGLAVSRKILREHGGDILLESSPGKGCQFTLQMPVKSPLSPDGIGQTREIRALKLPRDEA
jgi:signal transduction histidine kinase